MKSELFLGIDQGSSSTKAVLLNGAGEAVYHLAVPVPERHTEGECVEQDAEGLLASVLESFLKAKEWAQREKATICAAGLAFQRSGVVAWDSRNGAALHPMITWADTRTYPAIQNLGRGVEHISVQTGLPTIPNFAAGKIAILQRQFLDPFYYVGTLDSFVLHRLSGRKIFVTEDSMAARTMLYDLDERAWNASLCRAFKVDMKRLARINPSLAPHTTYEDIPILASLGDQQAALLGRLSYANRPLLNLGTIASIMVPTGHEAVRSPAVMTSVLASRLITSAAVREYRYLSEITSPVTGPALSEILRRGWASTPEEINNFCLTSYERAPDGRATAYFVNRRVSPPKWLDGVPNTMAHRAEADTADRVRAVVENVGNLIARMLEELREKGLLGDRGEILPLDIAGGGSEVDYLLQYVSDITGHELTRLPTKDAGARGAALCAWMSHAGHFDARPMNTEEPVKVYRPERPERRRRFLSWQKMEQDLLNGALPPHILVEQD